eukprot:119837-Prymnesium_polylepis.1
MHQERLQPVGDPRHLGVGVLDGKERSTGWHDPALEERVNGEGDVAAVFDDLAPARLVKDAIRAKRVLEEGFGLVDVRVHDADGADVVEEHLEAKVDDMRQLSACARLKERAQERGALWQLGCVRRLVHVRPSLSGLCRDDRG